MSLYSDLHSESHGEAGKGGSSQDFQGGIHVCNQNLW